MSDEQQTQGRIDTMFQRHQHQGREVSGPVRGSECSGGRAKPDDTAVHAAWSSDRRTQQHSQCVTQKSVRILNWNVEGLLSKLGEAEFIQYVSSFDIICFTETFLAYQSALDCFPDFVQFSRPAVKLSNQGRRSGGVLILVRRALENFVEVIDLTPDNIVVLKFDKTVFSSDKHVILCGAYVCPPDSPYYKQTHGAVTSSMSVIEQCLLDCAEKIEQSLFLLCGDFNARTGNLNNSLQDCEEDTYEFIQSDLRGYRQSQDKIVNAFGRLLLEMCATCDLTILNGACPGDELGNFTYVCSTGSSTIDYQFHRVC